MNLEELKQILFKTWGKDTCYPPQEDEWSPNNPAFGQCYTTAMIVNDYFGGKILKVRYEDGMGHFWNLIDGEEVDLTKSQFKEGEVIPTPRAYPRNEIGQKPGYDEINRRYKILKKRVDAFLKI